MKHILASLLLVALASLTSCEATKKATAAVTGWASSPAGKATLVAVSKATAIGVADILHGDKKAALGDAAGSVLDSIHAQANGNPALVVIDAAGHAALLDALKKQGTNKTLTDAGVAALNALVNGVSSPTAEAVPVTATTPPGSP